MLVITLETVYAPNSRAVLLDYLVGAGEMRGWNGEAERPGGPKVDDQLERLGLLDRNIGGSGSQKHLHHLRGMLAVDGDKFWSVGNQATIFSHLPPLVDGGQLNQRRMTDDLRSVGVNR
jgi:hypothetical protein